MTLSGAGLVEWSMDPLATVEEADAYASARGWSDWAALASERKTSALLDASTYVRAAFRAPQAISARVDAEVGMAVIEAARLSLTGPLLGGETAGQRVKRSVRAGSVSVEYEAGSTESLRKGRLALVHAILRGIGAFPLGGASVPLRKA